MTLTSKQQAVIELAISDEAVREHFFRHADGIIWFETLVQRGLLRPEHNPAPFLAEEGEGWIVPYWTALDYVVRTAKGLGQDDVQSAKTILSFVRDVSDYARDHGIDNYRTYFRLAEALAALPPSLVESEDIARSKLWLRSRFTNSLVAKELSELVTRLLSRSDQSRKDLALALFDVLTEIAIPSSSTEQHEEGIATILEPYWLKELFKNQISAVVTQVGLPAVELLLARIRLISDRLAWQDRSHWFRHAIEDHQQDDHQDLSPGSVFLSAARDALYLWTQAGGTAVPRVQQLLHGSTSVIRRIAISALDRNYEGLKDLTAAVLAPQFFVDENRHELYHFLRNHFARFEGSLRDVAVAAIENLTLDSDDAAEAERWTSHLRLQWFHALKDGGHDGAAAAYAKYRAIVDQDPEHPDFTSYMTSGWVTHKSPKSPEELGTMEPGAVVEFANAFQGSGSFLRDEPDEDGLAEAFEQAAKSNPEKFTRILAAYKGLLPRYMSRVLMGLRTMDGQFLSAGLGDIASALSEILVSEGGVLGREKPDQRSHDADYLVVEACRLIQKALQQKGATAAAYDACSNLLTGLVSSVHSQSEAKLTDAVGQAINSAKGVSTETLALYALSRRRELQDAEGPQHAWATVARTFDDEADKLKVGNYEFAAIVGKYLPNLMYLQREWVAHRFADIFAKNEEGVWRSAHQGLSYSRGAHNEVFDLLKSHGELRRALEANFDGTHVHEFLVQQIGMQYLRGREHIEGRDSHIGWLLNRWSSDHVSELVQFMWQVREAKAPDVRARGVQLWQLMSMRALVEPKLNRRLLSRLTMLSVWLERLDDPETLRILRAIAPYAARGHNESTLIKELRRFATAYPQETAEVLIDLTQESLPTYDEDDIRVVLRTLIDAGQVSAVRELCKRYFRAGLEAIVEPIVPLLD